jgi:hypothetical protein
MLPAEVLGERWVAYNKKTKATFWVRSDDGTAVHIGHVGEKPYILVNGTPASFSVSNALLIARQLIRHAIIAKIRKH